MKRQYNRPQPKPCGNRQYGGKLIFFFKTIQAHAHSIVFSPNNTGKIIIKKTLCVKIQIVIVPNFLLFSFLLHWNSLNRKLNLLNSTFQTFSRTKSSQNKRVFLLLSLEQNTVLNVICSVLILFLLQIAYNLREYFLKVK